MGGTEDTSATTGSTVRTPTQGPTSTINTDTPIKPFATVVMREQMSGQVIGCIASFSIHRGSFHPRPHSKLRHSVRVDIDIKTYKVVPMKIQTLPYITIYCGRYTTAQNAVMTVCGPPIY